MFAETSYSVVQWNIICETSYQGFTATLVVADAHSLAVAFGGNFYTSHRRGTWKSVYFRMLMYPIACNPILCRLSHIHDRRSRKITALTAYLHARIYERSKAYKFQRLTRRNINRRSHTCSQFHMHLCCRTRPGPLPPIRTISSKTRGAAPLTALLPSGAPRPHVAATMIFILRRGGCQLDVEIIVRGIPIVPARLQLTTGHPMAALD